MIGGANALGVPIGLAGQTIGGTYVPSASGSGFAAPIWGDAMKLYDDFLDYEDFVYPSTVPGAGVTSAGPPPCKRRCGGGGGDGNGERQRQRQRERQRQRRTGRRRARRPSWRRTSAATAPPSARPLTCGCHDAHHLAHRLHALAGGAGLLDRGGDDGGDVLVAERLGEVVGEDRGLGALLVGHLGAAAVVEGGRRLPALLRLASRAPR